MVGGAGVLLYGECVVECVGMGGGLTTFSRRIPARFANERRVFAKF